MILNQSRPYKISTADFGKEELSVWAFGGAERAGRYAAFLESLGRKESPVWVVDWLTEEQQEPPFLRQLFFGGVGSGSSFNGGRKLGFDDGAMGGVWGVPG